jgi:hypothetical protein
MLILLTMPAILPGVEAGKWKNILKPDFPDTIRGIQIQFEVKQVKRVYQDKVVNIYCLCADITNKNDSPERILIRYHCQEKAKSKVIEIGGRQQRIILVDKCLITEGSPADIKEYYNLVLLEYRQ